MAVLNCFQVWVGNLPGQAIGDVPKAVQILKDSCKSESIDLEDIVKSISNFESIGSALNNDFIQKNTFFQSLVESFTEFRGAFLDSVKVAVKSFEDAHLAIFQQFLDKYECVLPAAEKWQMQPVASFFNENQDETREALDQIIAAKSNAAGPMKALSQFCSHSTSCKDFKELIQQCGQLHKRSVDLASKANLTGSVLLAAALLLNTSSSPEDGKATQETMRKGFGITKEQLPSKLQKMFGDLVKSTAEAKGSGSAKDKKEKQSEKKDKRKREGGRRSPRRTKSQRRT